MVASEVVIEPVATFGYPALHTGAARSTVVNDAYTRYNSREKQERPSEDAANQANYGYTAQ